MESERFEVRSGGATLVGDRWRPQSSNGAPAVVFLHAGVCDRRSWAQVCELLAPDADLVAYDRRGYGETRTDAQPFSHLDDLLAVVESMGVATVWLVGNSMGGGLAIDAAIAHPSVVAGLVLNGPAVSGYPWRESEFDPDTLRLETAIEAADEAGDTESVNRLEAHLWLDGPGAPEGRVGGAARELALAMNAIALASGLPEGAGAGDEDAWDRLDEITIPVTVAWGELDLSLVAVCHALLGRLPHATSHAFAGMAHLPSLESPAAVADLVRAAVAPSEPAT